MAKLTPQVETDALRCLDEAKGHYETKYKNQYTYCSNLYNSVRNKAANAAKWRTNHFIPMVFAGVQTEVARFMDGLYGPDGTKFFKVTAKTLKDEESASAITSIQGQHMQEGSFYQVNDSAALNAHIYGIGWVFQGWDSRVENYEYFKTTGDKNKHVKVTKEYDCPKWESLSPFDVWVDPNAPQKKGALTYAVVRRFLRLSEIKKMRERYTQTKAVANLISVLKESDNSEDKPHEVCTVYKPGTFTTILENTVISHEDNPFGHHNIPLYAIIRYPDANMFGGIGIAKVLGDLQEGINDVWNLGMDNWKIAVNKLFARRRDALIPAGALNFEPGKVMSLEDIDADFKVFDMPGVSGDTFRILENMQGYINQATGSLDYLNAPSGIGSANKTAAGARIIVQEANRRFAKAIKTNKECFLVPMLRDLMSLYRQYINRKKVESVLGESQAKTLKISPKEINWDGEYDYIISGNVSLIDKAAQLENLKEGLPILKDLGFELNRDAIAAQVLDVLDLPKDIILDQEDSKEKATSPETAAPAPVEGAAAAQAPVPPVPPNVAQMQPNQNPEAVATPQPTAANPVVAQELAAIAQILGTTPDVLAQDIAEGKVDIETLKKMAVAQTQQAR